MSLKKSDLIDLTEPRVAALAYDALNKMTTATRPFRPAGLRSFLLQQNLWSPGANDAMETLELLIPLQTREQQQTQLLYLDSAEHGEHHDAYYPLSTEQTGSICLDLGRCGPEKEKWDLDEIFQKCLFDEAPIRSEHFKTAVVHSSAAPLTLIHLQRVAAGRPVTRNTARVDVSNFLTGMPVFGPAPATKCPLVAAILHSGGATGGHYQAVVSSQEAKHGWVLVSDRQATYVDESFFASPSTQAQIVGLLYDEAGARKRTTATICNMGQTCALSAALQAIYASSSAYAGVAQGRAKVVSSADQALMANNQEEPAPKPVSKPVPKPVSKPVPKPVSKPAPKPVSKPVPKPVSRPVPKPVSKPAPKRVSKPAPKRVSKPVPEPVLVPKTRVGARRSAPVPSPRPRVAQAQKVVTRVPINRQLRRRLR